MVGMPVETVRVVSHRHLRLYLVNQCRKLVRGFVQICVTKVTRIITASRAGIPPPAGGAQEPVLGHAELGAGGLQFGRLPAYAQDSWRRRLAAACAAHAALGPASLVLYDVSTLYFETDTGGGFREPGFSKERRLEPQITVGLLTDATGFPLMIEAFEGNKADNKTMLPVITAFMAAHQLTDVTVVADAGMISEANQHAIEDAGLYSSSAPASPASLCGRPVAVRAPRPGPP
jgi:hypothetical protein